MTTVQPDSILDRKACTFFDQKKHLPLSVNALMVNQQTLIIKIIGSKTPPFKAKYFWRLAQIPYFPSWEGLGVG
ncbi:MAG: hypothetical protein F6K39_29355 [Okeania sp. SIO3B3]|nr:hypothetical protein [Okeania sp. SIO3B3]